LNTWVKVFIFIQILIDLSLMSNVSNLDWDIKNLRGRLFYFSERVEQIRDRVSRIQSKEESSRKEDK